MPKSTVLLGDCIEKMAELPAGSVDAVVCDPPYLLGFMNKDWDSAKEADWHQKWAEQAFRVLKPGGHLVAFGGTRTYHRLVCGIEDAGFEIRDSLHWIYGCLSDDTELLTNEGWLFHSDIRDDHRALAFDVESGMLQWEDIQAVHRYQHDGEMVSLRGPYTDQLVTPNHRVILDASQSSIPYASSMRDLRDYILETECVGEANEESLLFVPLQRRQAGATVGTSWLQGASGVDRSEPGFGQSQDDGSEQPSMEGRCYRVQEARELCRSPIRESARVGFANGAQGRLHNGASAPDGGDVRVLDDSTRSCASRESRPEGQQTGEPDTLAVELESSNVRGRSHGRGGGLPCTPVEAEWVDYAGLVWCITVPSGAFVARRNGLIFATGNSGFPKSLDVSKAIDKAAGAERKVVGSYRVGGNALTPTKDKGGTYGVGVPNSPSGDLYVTAPATTEAEQWSGWGTALKPAHEPIVLARKPLSESTVAKNVLAHGTGAINIDASRVGYQGDADKASATPQGISAIGATPDAGRELERVEFDRPEQKGRWPANVLLSHSPECQQVGERDVKNATGVRSERSKGAVVAGTAFGTNNHRSQERTGIETVPAYQCVPGCPVAALGAQSGDRKAGGSRGDTGGASRFFPNIPWDTDDSPPFRYNAKASKRDRNSYLPAGETSDHPTVKPTALMAWLINLVTPLGGTVLDPFLGSGTTGLAAYELGFDFIGIEKDPKYFALARTRLINQAGGKAVKTLVSDLNEGDHALSYGTITSIKRGVGRWTISFDSGTVIKLPTTDYLRTVPPGPR